VGATKNSLAQSQWMVVRLPWPLRVGSRGQAVGSNSRSWAGRRPARPRPAPPCAACCPTSTSPGCALPSWRTLERISWLWRQGRTAQRTHDLALLEVGEAGVRLSEDEEAVVPHLVHGRWGRGARRRRRARRDGGCPAPRSGSSARRGGGSPARCGGGSCLALLEVGEAVRARPPGSAREEPRERTLPEFGSLPSAGGFAECFLSGTRQSRLCRAPHSAKSYAR
jgi:hypothetical protein